MKGFIHRRQWKSEEVPREEKGLAHAMFPAHTKGYAPRMQRLSISHRTWKEEEESFSEIHRF